jgi:hypothetical protein
MYFLRGSLPWQGLPSNTSKETNRAILERKQAMVPDELCNGFPSQLRDYLVNCRNLGFEEKPDYAYLKKLFQDLFESEGFQDDGHFDWVVKKEERPDSMFLIFYSFNSLSYLMISVLPSYVSPNLFS